MKKVLRLNGVPLRAPPYGVPPYAKNEKGKREGGMKKRMEELRSSSSLRDFVSG